MKHLITFVTIFFVSVIISFAEKTTKIDSLKQALVSTNSDTNKVDLLIELSKYYINSDSTLTLKYLRDALLVNEENALCYRLVDIHHLTAYTFYKNLKYNVAIQNINRGIILSTQQKDTSRLASLYYFKGSVFSDIGEYDSSLKNLSKGLNLFNSIGNKSQIAEGYRCIGETKWLQGDYTLATEYTEKAIPLYDSTGYETGKAWAFNTLAILCFEQDLYDQALQYYNSAYEILLKNNEISSLSAITLNKGEIYWKRKDYEKALELYNASLEISLKYNIRSNIAYCYTNIGIVYHEMRNYALAKENYDKAMLTWEDIGDKTGLIYCLNYLAILKLDQGFINNSIIDANRVLKISKQIGSKDETRRAYETLSKAYSKIGEYKKAYDSHVFFKKFNDSIFDGKAKNRLLSIESRNKLEKQKQQLEIQTIELKLKDSKIKQQTTQRNALLGGLGLITIVIFLVAYAYVQKRKANVEITKQKNEIENQKIQIETIHEEVTSSIRYAKRIQGAVLPSDNQMTELLGDHFLLFKPKDIVSGDFYWVTKVKGWLIFCVADCTGHGVPGAFMSMLGVSFLNDIVHKENVTSASEVLNHLRVSIIDALKQKGEGGEQKDGMDIGLCAINTETNQMQFAGGYNPCWVVPNPEFSKARIHRSTIEQEDSVIQLKPDKMPIAIHRQMEPFTNHLVQLYPGDQIYLLSDGFQDQFGGPQGKKFMVKKLRELVVANASLPMNNQREALEKALEEWKNGVEQVDDVTILGIRLS
ncbi:MAG TPA: tetratricopeptide repeat protein [Tenuifilaceae bacterium]|nr:tetratricopeptide repeat protein [Tenuifilaceae bacterium]HPE17086.1 tetratricopeptide repeat protein [Tenuifilaceae bacterium]HPJ44814.1 tetratricopeptide repeat protein [Tenuifilaceae bacterium]HPQ32892.1 tetratricopeptide repeat protein [Tenuifilaceae bacterium]HRX67179.1 tetratricopeptide repeat protein [Tenuifilaceae bacterium]